MGSKMIPWRLFLLDRPGAIRFCGTNKGGYMKELDYAQVEELVEHTDLLLDNAKANLEDINRAIKDPSFLKSAMKQREMILRRKMSEILRGQAELRDVLTHK